MTSFIQDVIADIQKRKIDISQLSFILPSKRAGVFLKHTLSQNAEHTFFAPDILSIEEFVETLSDLQYATNVELLFEFYDVYLKNTPKEQIEPFDDFSKWAQLLIQDFNEIDRYLIASDQIFDYLKAIKEINHWSLEKEPTSYIKNYLLFWNQLKSYYTLFKAQLISKSKGYQGLVYREAVNNIEQHIALNKNKKYVFVGFNALNKAEETIVQELLQQDLALIYWDIDAVFMNNPIHDAGYFTRAHKKNWPFFKQNSFNWITDNYAHKKHIEIIGTPKNIGQIKYIGELLHTISQKNKTLQNTAVVLGDENLLMPLLNSIPEQIDAINITMGLPLKSIPLASLFDALFKLHKTDQKTVYYKDVVTILTHQFIKPLFIEGSQDYSDLIIAHIQDNNVVYLNIEKLKKLSGVKCNVIELLFASWKNNPGIAIDNCSKLIFIIKAHLNIEKTKNLLSLEYLYRFNEVFNSLNSLNALYEHIYNINTLFGLYKEIMKSETLDFKGEPLKGLQIMGMLESRVLDFETVIISSVNEGILPAGKSNNSFIPFDVKIENGMPTYKEKDAVYTYHFYKLLQRATTIYIVYNTEPDVLNGGEKSRFITQLEIENRHKLKHIIVSPKVPLVNEKLKTVPKSPQIINRLKDIADKGFSPSSLTNYIRNPMDFYYQKVLKINQYEDVEETVAANTLGNVIHKTLEDFYNPLKQHFLSLKHLHDMKLSIDKTVEFHFKAMFKEGDITKGKNLIIFEIAKRYINNFLNKETEELKAGNEIKIIDLERSVKIPIHIPELAYPVNLIGSVDRIDEYNGTTRIIDYKSGKVDQNQVEIINWEAIDTDYKKYSKSFQVLCYAYMLNLENPFKNPVEAGIISFKNLQGNYFLKFTKKDKAGSYAKKDTLISQDTLNDFEIELKKVILEICNPSIDFIEKEIL
jgi:ATP-dependent helicase/nuclease subunit B